MNKPITTKSLALLGNVYSEMLGRVELAAKSTKLDLGRMLGSAQALNLDAYAVIPALIELGRVVLDGDRVHDACDKAGLRLTSAQVDSVLRVLNRLAHNPEESA